MNTVTAQSFEGLYLTAEDFESGHLLTYGSDCRIKVHEIFKRTTIELRCSDTVISRAKADVYGFVDSEGQVARIFEGEIYTMVNPSEKIIIYKQSTGTGLKGSPIVDLFYFSKSAAESIMPFNQRTVFQAFNDNPGFLMVLELFVRTDDDLLLYDTLHQVFKINRLFEISQHLVLTHN